MSKKLRKIGITATWADCLLMLPFIVILVQGVNSSFIDTSVVKSGQASRAPLSICFLTANHNSLLTLILGIPFERAIKYHKISGYVAFLNGIFHTFAAWEVHYRTEGQNSNIKSVLSGSTVNTSGTMILCTICSMLITAFPYVRRKAFEVFYYLHILFAMLMIGCAFYHSGVLVPVAASCLWGGDILMRKVYMAHYRYPRTASISQLTDTVVQVSFLKTARFDYNPGQYVKVAVPDISVFQWHPISISSSPHQECVTLHIRTRGSWTKKLYALAEKKREIHILLEGPYGSLAVDLTNNRYLMMMLLSGGIGVTPMQSIAHQLMHVYECKERQLTKVWFVWTARDPEVMTNMEVARRYSSASMQSSFARYSTVSMQSFSLEASILRACPTELHVSDKADATASSSNDDAEGLSLQASEKKQMKDLSEIQETNATEVDVSCTTFTTVESVNGDTEGGSLETYEKVQTDDIVELEKTNVAEVDVSDKADTTAGLSDDESGCSSLETYEKTQMEDLFERVRSYSPEVYKLDMTDAIVGASNDEAEDLSREIHEIEMEDLFKLDCYLTVKEMRSFGLEDLPYVHLGRPDMKKMFLKMRKEAILRGEKRVAVCVCAPSRLVYITREACVKYSNRHVRFDLHCEVFD